MKQTLKIIALLLCAVLAVSALAGCGEKTPEPQPEPAPQYRDPMDIYAAFLAGDEQMSPDYELYGLMPGASYNASSMAETVRKGLVAEWGMEGLFLGDVHYAYIDAGMDGALELAMDIQYLMPGEYVEPYDVILFFKAHEDQLNMTADTYSYYRTSATVNNAGFIQQGGSSSAMSSFFDYSFLESWGSEQFLYSAEYAYGYADPVLPEYYLPVDEVPAEYADHPDEFTFDGGYEIDRYNFLDSTQFNYEDEKDWQNYRKGYCYVILDQNGNDVDIIEPFASLYGRLGVEIVKNEDMNGRIMEACEANGCSTDVITAGEPDWTLLDAARTPKG